MHTLLRAVAKNFKGRHVFSASATMATLSWAWPSEATPPKQARDVCESAGLSVDAAPAAQR